MNHQNMPPPWTSLWLRPKIEWYDSIAWPCLAALAIISASTAVLGYSSQFDNPDLGVYLRCILIGLGLYCVIHAFWAALWLVPVLETRTPSLIFFVVAVTGFLAFAIPSTLGSLSANSGGISLNVTQQGDIDALDNTRQEFAAYVGQMTLMQAALADRAAQARILQADEIAGRGPTGVQGVGSVSNSYGASAVTFDSAAELIDDALSRAQSHFDALDAILSEMRVFQSSGNVTGSQAAAQLDVLTGQAIAEMRALLALDPARTIRAAASNIAQGVPPRSQANTQSQARIAEISAGMRAYAAQMLTEADRIEALAPDLPQQSTLSPAERLIETMWRTPGLSALALVFDLCGFVVCFFRLALYQAFKSKLREENERPVPSFVMMEDFEKVEVFVDRSEETKKRIEAAKGAKRRRPRLTGPAKMSPTKRKPRSTTKPTSAKKPGGKDDA